AIPQNLPEMDIYVDGPNQDGFINCKVKFDKSKAACFHHLRELFNDPNVQSGKNSYDSNIVCVSFHVSSFGSCISCLGSVLSAKIGQIEIAECKNTDVQKFRMSIATIFVNWKQVKRFAFYPSDLDDACG
ncbi:hypothetical protein PENTCL1PPCAC_12650, partial [Pristionchus entomophagus]